MKKRLVLKILLDIVLVVAIVFCIYEGVVNLQSVRIFHDLGLTVTRAPFFQESICYFLSAILHIVFFILFNLKDGKVLKDSILKRIKDYKEATAEERKQKKIEELEKQLDELKKDS